MALLEQDRTKRRRHKRKIDGNLLFPKELKDSREKIVALGIPLDCFSTDKVYAAEERMIWLAEHYADKGGAPVINKLTTTSLRQLFVRTVEAMVHGKTYNPEMLKPALQRVHAEAEGGFAPKLGDDMYPTKIQPGTLINYLQHYAKPSQLNAAKLEVLNSVVVDDGVEEGYKRQYRYTSNALLIFNAANDPKNEIISVWGGSSSGKTVAILMWIIADCQKHYNQEPFFVGNTSYPQLEGGVIPAFINIMKDWRLWDDKSWKGRPVYEYTFSNGSRVKFRNTADPENFRGPRYRGAFLNEVNIGTSEEAFMHIAGRLTPTYSHRAKVFLDYNPTKSGWYQTTLRENPRYQIRAVEVGELCYRGNECLDQRAVDRILTSFSLNPHTRKVYIDGLPGDTDDLIFPNIQILMAESKGSNYAYIPHDAVKVGYGLDFGAMGSNNSYTAVCSLYKWGDAYIVNEEIYGNEISVDNHLIPFFNADLKRSPIVADRNRKDDIHKMKKLGLPVIPANMGAGSVLTGIEEVKSRAVFLTENSVNFIKESQAYSWGIDRDGRKTDRPDKTCMDDCMDAMRYAFQLTRDNLSNRPKRQNAYAEFVRGGWGG